MGKEKGKKKGKKSGADDLDGADQMSAVDRQFYELTISDLNAKLSRLRTHNAKLEEKNEELEGKMRQMEEDKSDTTAYLNRTLNEKLNIISELEDKLSELSKVRDQENQECKRTLGEREAKFKAMHDQLTSEIKLLTGKLNSMEEFRIQRDELLAKFDAQETDLKEQHKKHKVTLYEMERKVILDKDRLRKEVENRLLELSTEFTKSSQIRVAAHTQRLVRENIALNNEMDRMICTHERLRSEHEEMRRENQQLLGQARVVADEKAKMVRTCQTHIGVIARLTDACERLQFRAGKLQGVQRSHDGAVAGLREAQTSAARMAHKVRLLEQHVHAINTERQSLLTDVVLRQQQMDHVCHVLKTVQATVQSALRGEEEGQDSNEDFEWRLAQRRALLNDLMNILTELDAAMPTEKPSVETLPPPSSLIYLQGDLGILPKHSADSILARSPPRTESIVSIPPKPRLSLADMPSTFSMPVVDVVSGTILEFERSDNDLPDEDEEEFEDGSDVENDFLFVTEPRKQSIRRRSSAVRETPRESEDGSETGAGATLTAASSHGGESEKVIFDEEDEGTGVEVDQKAIDADDDQNGNEDGETASGAAASGGQVV